jgi:hypothetical protein
MTQTWAKPCPDSVPDPTFDAVSAWVAQTARRRSGVSMLLGSSAGLIRACARATTLPYDDVSDRFTALEDGECIERTDEGFLVTEEFLGTCRLSRRRRGEEAILVAKRLDGFDTTYRVEPRRATPAVKQGSVQNEVGTRKPRVDLCHYFFPDLVEERGLETVRRDVYWKALYSQVQRLQLEYRLDLPFVRRMMEEFVQHPEWCQRSSRAAWQVFISRWQQLIRLVHAQRRRDPGNRRHSGGAEYWMGKYAGLEARA